MRYSRGLTKKQKNKKNKKKSKSYNKHKFIVIKVLSHKNEPNMYSNTEHKNQ